MYQIPLTEWTSIYCQIPPLEQTSDTLCLSQAVNAMQQGSLAYYGKVKVCGWLCWSCFRSEWETWLAALLVWSLCWIPLGNTG